MVSEADELFSGLEKIFDVFFNGLLLGGGRGVEPLEEDSSPFRLRKTLALHLSSLALHLAPVPERKHSNLFLNSDVIDVIES